MKVPNFFIVGAPKSGTTSMYHYIKEHPNVYMSDVKEPHYFSKDMVGLPTHEYSREEYLNLFEDVNDHHRIVGESSTEYLISTEGLEHIRSFNPSAKILVMLRNPVDLVHAWHHQMLKQGVENVTDFQEAWNLQEARSKGEQIPNTCAKPRRLQYKKGWVSWASYGTSSRTLPEGAGTLNPL